jgi:hypothetical protein
MASPSRAPYADVSERDPPSDCDSGCEQFTYSHLTAPRDRCAAML